MAEPAIRTVRFEFSGSGSEYFRIWAVNLLLTLLTLGIYSAWAKVRREQYFCRNTRFAGASFDYHGKPVPILLGRILAFGLIILSQSTAFGGTLAGLALLVTLLALPWLMVKSAQFRLANSSYRGIRFEFVGRPKQAYRVYGVLLGALLALILLAAVAGSAAAQNWLAGVIGLLLLASYPLLHAAWRKFFVNQARFGNGQFGLVIRKRDFLLNYAIGYGGALLLLFVLTAVLVPVLGLTDGTGSFSESPGRMLAIVLMVLSLYSVVLSAQPVVTARLHNLCWNATTLSHGPNAGLHVSHQFHGDLQVGAYVGLQLRNWLFTLLTLGLYRPFAAVNSVRMRLGALSMSAEAEIEQIVSGIGTPSATALGSEASELLGFDLSL